MGTSIDLLSGATSTGAGTEVDLTYNNYQSCTIYINWSGTLAGMVVKLQHKCKGGEWSGDDLALHTLSADAITAKSGSFAVEAKLNVIRINIVTLTNPVNAVITVTGVFDR